MNIGQNNEEAELQCLYRYADSGVTSTCEMRRQIANTRSIRVYIVATTINTLFILNCRKKNIS